MHARLPCVLGFRARVLDAGEWEVVGLTLVRILPHPQLVTDFHHGEHALGREHGKQLFFFFARVDVEVEEGSPGQAGLFTHPDAIEMHPGIGKEKKVFVRAGILNSLASCIASS